MSLAQGSLRLVHREPKPGSVMITTSGVKLLCDFRGSGMSATWGRDGQILFAAVGGEAIYQVAASGGTPVEVMKPNAARGERRAVFPWYLPDGRRFLYSARLLDGGRVMLADRAGRKPIPGDRHRRPGRPATVDGGAELDRRCWTA